MKGLDTRKRGQEGGKAIIIIMIISALNVIALHSIAVRTFYSKPKMSTLWWH